MTTYITKSEAADRAGVHISTIGNWIKQGRLAKFWRGRTVVVDEAELDALTAVRPA